MTRISYGKLPRCPTCDAEAGADHSNGCSWLGALRAQSYPELLEQNGCTWWDNRLCEQASEIKRLQALVRELGGEP